MTTIEQTDAPQPTEKAAKAKSSRTRAEKAPKSSRQRKKVGRAAKAAVKPNVGKERAGTKQALLIEMLKRTEGATIDEVIAATGWQAHTVRGAIAGALKKRLGLNVDSEKVEGRGRVYRVAA